ncbi:MAG: AAA family ATPase, partial [Candidatus Thorarchaeota archaeon]
MAKKPTSIKKDTTKTISKQTTPKLSKPPTSTTPKSTQTKSANKELDNLTILKNSPYLNQNVNQNKTKTQPTLSKLFETNLLSQKEEKLEIILSGQYKEALDLIFEADASNLYPILVGPPGIGKTTICRYYAQSRAEITGNDSFEWITFDESTKPAHLIGSFNPATTIQKGFSFDA